MVVVKDESGSSNAIPPIFSSDLFVFMKRIEEVVEVQDLLKGI